MLGYYVKSYVGYYVIFQTMSLPKNPLINITMIYNVEEFHRKCQVS